MTDSTAATRAAATPRVTARALIAVLVGGAVGTGLRLAVDLALPSTVDEFAPSTLVVNVVGSFTLGLFVATIWPRVPHWVRAGLGAGMLGSFTTFSALSLSVVTLADSSQAIAALVTVVGTVTLGLLAALAGLATGGRLAPATEASE